MGAEEGAANLGGEQLGAVSVPPPVQDHGHSLGQVVHGAICCHRWVPLIAGPEGEVEVEARAFRTSGSGIKLRQPRKGSIKKINKEEG